MSLRPLLLIPAFMLLVGCTDTLQVVRSGQPPQLLRNATVLVATPADGRYDTKVYTDSGQQTAAAAAAVFAKFVQKADVAGSGLSMDAALVAAAAGRYTYLVYPTITHWEDRRTEWSLRSDNLAVRLVITEVATRRTLDDVSINGISKTGTLGGDHPQNMLEPSFEKYVRTLYGEPAK